MSINADPSEYKHLSQKERMTLGYPYDCYCDEIVQLRTASRKLLREINALEEDDLVERQKLMKLLLHPDSASNIKSIVIQAGFRVDYGFNILIAENCNISYNCCILDVGYVKIGKNFKAGPSVHIYTASHPLNYEQRRSVDFSLPVTIGDDVLIEGHSIILPGVTIGHGAVVRTGSVVTKNVPDYTIVSGSPARPVETVNSQ